MKPYYSTAQKRQIAKEFHSLYYNKVPLVEINSLLLTIAPTNTAGTEIYQFCHYGIGRRLIIMHQCVQNVFDIRPIEQDEPPTEQEALNLTINLQTFFIHLYGIFENLARVYALSIKFNGELRDISFFEKNEKLLKTLPNDIYNNFMNDIAWYNHIKSLRHPLAHQEPFYIPKNDVIMDYKKEWETLEKEKQELQNRHLFALCDRAFKEQQRNSLGIMPSIEELNKELQQHNKLEQQLEQDIQKLCKKQSEYEMFIPMIVTNTQSEHRIMIQYYPQILVDMKTVYQKLALILKHICSLEKDT